MAETCDIRLRKHPTKKDTALRSHLVLDMEKILLQDVSDAVVQVAACEARNQKELGNEVSNYFVNNKPAGQIPIRSRSSSTGHYAFRVRMLFGQTNELANAALEVMQLLRSLTRIRSGRAIQSYEIYLGNTANSSNPGVSVGHGISGIIDLRRNNLITENSMISIIGPNTIYGRKLYWNPKGGKTVAKRLAKPRGLGALVKLETSTGGYRGSATIHRDVKKRMARSVKWKAFSFADPFYVMTGFKIIGDKRVPAISITMKAAGRLN